MKALSRLAWCKVWRHRRRTILLVLAVAYAAFGGIFFWGLNDGIIASVLTTQVRFVAAPVLVVTTAYWEDPDPEHALPDFAVVAAAAVTNTAVVSVIERTREFGMIAALCMAPGRLARLVVLETAITTAIGWAVGLAAGTRRWPSRSRSRPQISLGRTRAGWAHGSTGIRIRSRACAWASWRTVERRQR